jgi:hypothetical protein
MSDLDQELRELLETKARDGDVTPKPEPQVLKRARRRQAGTVLAAIAGTAALVAASIVGLQTLARTSPDTPTPGDVPVLPDAPEGFRAVALPLASIAYPEDWFLVAFDPDEHDGRVLQLANFDVRTSRVNCEESHALPPGGLILEMQLGAGMDPLPAWPAPLGVVPGPGRPCGAEAVLAASWITEYGEQYSAMGLLSGDASERDRELLLRAYGTLAFPDRVPQTEELLGKANVILDSMNTPVGPVVLYAYEEPCEGSNHWIGIAGPSGSGLAGATGCGQDEIPTSDANVTMNLDQWGGVVWGEVAATVARAELRTVEGETFPAELIPMPPSLGVEDAQVVWGIVEGPTDDRVTTLLYDEQGSILNDFFPAGPRVTIAEGTDPDSGAWVLYLDVTSEGAGLGFRFETGGGGGGCCLQPFGGDFRLDGWGSGGDEPANITAIGSDVLDRVVFEAASGEQIEGQVFPIPDESLGVPKVALVLVPSDVALEGDLVGYDADGNEIGREFVGEVGEPSGPTPEIDAVWRNLRAARDAAAMYFGIHGSFAAVTPDALIDLATERVTFANRPEPEVAHLFVTDDTHLVISAEMTWGEAYCIAMEADPPDGGFGYRYGAVFAESYDECRGGWPELKP